MATGYEWDIETWCDDEVIDHDHRDRLDDFGIEQVIMAINQDNALDAGTFYRLVLVRTVDGGDRLWAYVDDDGKLPEYFSDSLGGETSIKVPKRFHEEYNR